ncbi:MAG: glutaconyl-CoA decarboxylase subunit beta [Clostridia bacterium]|nr:MAG: glutaconyl-CoA decarboxylase subunit beta [Clostridia bacterium]
MGFLTAAAGTFSVGDTLYKLAVESGFAGLVVDGGWRNLVMIVIACVLLYLGIVKGFEPLLLVGIAFGCLLANISYFPGLSADLNATNALYHPELWDAFLDPNSPYYHSYGHILTNAGLLDVFYIGVKAGIYPSIIFMGVGAMTDFGPLIADPKSLLLGAAAQLGVFVAFFGAILLGFTGPQAASIGIIGGADGPTAIFLTTKLAPELLGAIAIAAYSYMALIPLIQPPIMKLMTSAEDRKIKMTQSRPVSKTEKILFPIIVTIFVVLLLPSTAPLIGCLMLGNLFRECGVTDRLSDTVQNALMNIITIMLSTSVGATMVASNFLKLDTIKIVFLGLVAFGISTAGGLIGGNIMCKVTGKKVNPLIGSAGVSAVPMAARVSQVVGQKENPANFLLMHAMGPNVAGVIGSAIAAGFLLAVFG